VTARKLRAQGIHRLVDVRAVEEAVLRDAVGQMADWLRQLAKGIDERPVVAHRDVKSSGSENTYPEDLTDLETIRREVAEMAGHAASWLERRNLLSRTITLKVRYSNFTTITRSHTADPCCDLTELSSRAVALLAKTEAGRRPIRLLGVSVHNLCTPDQPSTGAPEWLPFSAT
jgi:DNA polymerase IV